MGKVRFTELYIVFTKVRNIDWGHSLELLHFDGSNEYPVYFEAKIRNIS